MKARAAIVLLFAACSGPLPPQTSAPCASGEACTADQRCAAGTVLRDGVCQPAGWTDCADGFESAGEGRGCYAVHPDRCPAGTRRALGDPQCVTVGPPTCAAGFVRHADGGCAAILPDAPCPAGTMEVIGEPACQPVDPCSRAFPPANATVVVDASGQLPGQPRQRRLGHPALAEAAASDAVS